jgi:hypothetical protein
MDDPAYLAARAADEELGDLEEDEDPTMPRRQDWMTTRWTL